MKTTLTIGLQANSTLDQTVALDRGRYILAGGVSVGGDATCALVVTETDGHGGFIRSWYPSGSSVDVPGPEYVIETSGGSLRLQAFANTGSIGGGMALVKVS